MKKMTLLVMIAFSILTAHAQSLKFLSDQNKIGFAISYDEAVIRGLDASEIQTIEGDWDKDQPVLISKLLEKLNAEQTRYVFSNNTSHVQYILVLHPTYISEKGDMRAYACIVDQSGQEYARFNKLNAKGGKFGTFLNLTGDGMRRMGQVLASRVKKGK